VIEAYKKDIDREDWKLTVAQRFEQAMAHQKFAEELRRAGEEARRKK